MRSRWFLRLGVALGGSALAFVLLSELALRLLEPPSVRLFNERSQGTPGERVLVIDEGLGVHPRFGIFVQDEKLGYRPKPGGQRYGPHGAKWNDYPLEKTSGKRRLLFLGDSVTDRGKVIDALRAGLGDDYEYWNAGVVGYGSQQELGYYRDYLQDIQPDHVLLTFHLNDYETTPITFMDGDRFIAVYGKLGSARPNPWLLRNSFLYRFLWGRRLGRSEGSRSRAIEQEVAGALRGFQALVRERGAEFTVLVLPWLLERGQWSEVQRLHHEQILALLSELGVRHFSFVDTLDQALADGITIHEQKNDVQHPSVEFGQRMAQKLIASGFRP